MNPRTHHDDRPAQLPDAPEDAPPIVVENLCKAFRETVAVRDVTFTVERGEVFGILGPNGAGKTTTVECIAGAVAADAGRIRVLGVDPLRRRQHVRERVGYQMQSAVLPAALRVEEAVRLFASFYQDSAPITDLLNAVGLEAHRRRPFGTLSGGQKQRLSIALALIGKPEVVVLDELTTGLDPQGRRDVWRLIEGFKGRGITFVLVSHHLDEVERLCDRFAIIASGTTRFVGTPAQFMNRWSGSGKPRTLDDAYVAFLEQTETGGGAR